MNVSSEITSKTSKNSHDNLDHNNFKSFIIAHKCPSGRDASSLPKYLGVIPPWRSKVWLLMLAVRLQSFQDLKINKITK